MKQIIHFRSQEERLAYLKGELKEVVPKKAEKPSKKPSEKEEKPKKAKKPAEKKAVKKEEDK